MTSSRERNYLRRLTAAIMAHDETSLDLFREVEIAARRKRHLILIIRRKYRQLKIYEPLGLETLDESQLYVVRFALSKQIALGKMASPAGEIAA